MKRDSKRQRRIPCLLPPTEIEQIFLGKMKKELKENKQNEKATCVQIYLKHRYRLDEVSHNSL